jgi:hypothetical protein
VYPTDWGTAAFAAGGKGKVEAAKARAIGSSRFCFYSASSVFS